MYIFTLIYYPLCQEINAVNSLIYIIFGALTERPPTECPLNIFTLMERPPNGTSTWTFNALDI